MKTDTIAAITTALGPSSVGIIRISGDDAGAIADKVFKAKKGQHLITKPTYSITYGKIYDDKGNIIDEALALTMWEPNSFTGENVVELQCHGGPIVLQKVLEVVLRSGARLAEPGEFSKRAFLNGKMDLTQAEAIMDIINAKTETAVFAAASNMRGSIKDKVTDIRKNIINLMAYLEADIDFPEDDIERLSVEEISQRLNIINKEIQRLIDSYNSGRILRDGLRTILIGKPNVGKSSILNALLKEKRAIVTDIPGTTRDVIEEYYNIGGIPVVLIDTAGLRETEDIVERIGVEKTKEKLFTADLILYVIDITESNNKNGLLHFKNLNKDKVLILVNKHDLMPDKFIEEEIKNAFYEYQVLFISATAQYGLEELKDAIFKMYSIQGIDNKYNTPFINNIRHKDALNKAKQAIISAIDSTSSAMPSDFISIDLKQAWLSMGEISGETLEEDIIDQIFSQFCLGK